MKKLRQTLLFLAILFSSNANAQLWFNSLEQAQQIAKQQNKLLLVDFYADWCGPCKQLDMDVWSNDSAKELMKKYVLVKINVDYNKSDASSYGVKGIPHIAIATPWNNVLYQFVGYRDLSRVKPILKRYPENVKSVYLNMENFKKEENFNNATQLAMAYQSLATQCHKMGINDFIKQSNITLSKAKKLCEKSDKTALEKVELMRMVNSSIIGQHKRVLKYFTKKKSIDKVQIDNKAIALCALSNSYAHSNQPDKANELKSQIENKNYLQLTNQLMKLKK